MATRKKPATFIYLSQIIDLPVVDASKKKIGSIYDVIANISGMYPRVTGIIVKTGLRKKLYYPWKDVKKIDEEAHAVLDADEEGTIPEGLSENELLLRETFWDKQIVDIAGSKVVRVNDLHILKDGVKLWMVHVDVGVKGLMRRLGWGRFIESSIMWLFGYELRDRFIPWKYVQPITSADNFKSLALVIPHSKLAELHPADLADILIDLGAEERLLIFNSFDDETASDILQELPLKMRVLVAESLESDRLARILDVTPMDEVVDLLGELTPATVNVLYGLLKKDEVLQIMELMQHSRRIAGSLMNTEFISATELETAGQVLRKIRKLAPEVESIYYVYVLDGEGRPVGVLTIKQLLVAEQKQPVGDIMRENVVRVTIDTRTKDVAAIFYKYNFTVVPVVDENGRIEGVITMKDALEAVFPEIREETEES